MSEDFLKDYLVKRRKEGTFRQLPVSETGIDFLSNDYLGLSRDGSLRANVEREWANDQHTLLGGTGSRLLSGNHPLYETLENQLVDLFDAEAALVFNSGYQANQSLISSVAGKDDVVLYDELSHVCLKEGAWLSRGRSYSFRHNDIGDLERRLNTLKESAARLFVVTETLFSMDGDFAPMSDILDVCESHGAYLIVDEAHTTGIFGHRGGGWLIDRKLHHRVFARVYTFGKAIGCHGACVVGSQLLRDFLVNTGRSFIYTTSLPPHTLRTLIESFKYLSERPSLAVALHKNITYFRQKHEAELGKAAASQSAVQPIAIAGAERCLAVADGLKRKGYDIMAIRAPTVRAGTERLRICLHNYNTEAEIDGLLAGLKELNSTV